MYILAIDCATPAAGVALLHDDRLLKEEFSNHNKKHAPTLMVTVDRVLSECDLTLQQLDVLACTIGPGSFTGLRIGLATIKGLSLAASKPVIAISTLDMLAENIYGAGPALITPLLNARKDEIYTAFYRTGPGHVRLSEDMACSPLEYARRARQTAIEQGVEKIILLGDGYSPYREIYREELGSYMAEAPCHLMLPRASSLLTLARRRALSGEFDDVWALRPNYLRLAEAEYRRAKE